MCCRKIGELAPEHISKVIAIKLYYDSWLKSGTMRVWVATQYALLNYKLELKVEIEERERAT